MTQPFGGPSMPPPPPGSQPYPGYAPEQSYAAPGGYSPYGAYGQVGGPVAPPAAPVLAPWGKRAIAYLIDSAPGLVAYVLFLIGYGFFLVEMIRSQDGRSFPELTGPGVVLMGVGSLLLLVALGWQIFNRWIRGGRTGQSLGKRITKIKLVSEQTGEPIGAVNAFARDLVHILDGALYVGYLWPLWDDKKQTFSDMLMHTLVVMDPATSPSTAPPQP